MAMLTLDIDDIEGSTYFLIIVTSVLLYIIFIMTTYDCLLH